jgi:translation elongation factor P/translation initiation factor 5A
MMNQAKSYRSLRASLVNTGVQNLGVPPSVSSTGESRVTSPAQTRTYRYQSLTSVSPASLQLMDLETYETRDVAKPNDEEIASKIEAGKDVEYWIIMDRVKIQRVKN